MLKKSAEPLGGDGFGFGFLWWRSYSYVKYKEKSDVKL